MDRSCAHPERQAMTASAHEVARWPGPIAPDLKSAQADGRGDSGVTLYRRLHRRAKRDLCQAPGPALQLWRYWEPFRRTRSSAPSCGMSPTGGLDRACLAREQGAQPVIEPRSHRRAALRHVGTRRRDHRRGKQATARVHRRFSRRYRVAGLSALAPTHRPYFRRAHPTWQSIQSGCVQPAYAPFSDGQQSHSAMDFSDRGPCPWVARGARGRIIQLSKDGHYTFCFQSKVTLGKRVMGNTKPDNEKRLPGVNREPQPARTLSHQENGPAQTVSVYHVLSS